MTLYCATGNPGKLREFRLAAERYGIQLAPLAAFRDIPACAETGQTFEENARLKAAYYGPYAPGLLFADDSGLEVDALGGSPGVYSARFAGEKAGDEANNRLLLERMIGQPNRKARFVCAIAVADGAQVVQTFHGAVEGLILDEPRGSEGFGYDPLFYYPPFGRTFGETHGQEKLRVSHRGRALEAMLEWLARRA